MADLIKPKEIEVSGIDGVAKKFIISRVPAIPARELVAKYPVSNMPKIGDYAVSEEVMLKLMSYVEVVTDNGSIRLNNKDLVNNHVECWEMLAKIEMHMMEYNVSFFGRAKTSISLEGMKKMAQQWITEILTDSLGQSLVKKQQPSKN